MSRGDSQAQGWMRKQLLLSAACKRRQQKDEARMARKTRLAAKTAGEAK